jgi:hypothetical protein
MEWFKVSSLTDRGHIYSLYSYYTLYTMTRPPPVLFYVFEMCWGLFFVVVVGGGGTRQLAARTASLLCFRLSTRPPPVLFVVFEMRRERGWSLKRMSDAFSLRGA